MAKKEKAVKKEEEVVEKAKPVVEPASKPAIVQEDMVLRRGTSVGGSTKMLRSEYLKQMAKENANS